MFAMLIVAALCVFTTSVAFAGGDQNRGDEGQGTITQVQVQDPPPFQP